MPGVPPARYAYLGPAGTFTEQALRSLPAARGARAEPYSSVALALDAVRCGEVDGAVVPFENSVEGSVSVTLDELATGEPLMITREMTVPVQLALLAPSGRDLTSVRTVASHPHAAAQARGWLARHLPGAEVVHVGSTAMAAAMVAGVEGHPGEYDAAIAAPLAAERYGLVALADSVGANPDAVTRFVLVSRPGPVTARTGADKTSLVAYIRDDHAGALMEVLDQFTMRGINLTRIESRPTGRALGRYCFSIDCEGHLDDERVGEALMGLRRICAEVRYLGSYPRLDGTAPDLRLGTSDADFLDARSWLARLRGGGTAAP
ncbi:MAG: prephenate dehydratase [Nocardioidaceae bacterium]|nr:prephenate dehydratase [Nocardioidaceae bacterium]